MVLFQKYVRQFGPSTKMAPTAEPNFDGIVFGWSSSKIVSAVGGALQCNFGTGVQLKLPEHPNAYIAIK
jgi:hypothetical protein